MADGGFGCGCGCDACDCPVCSATAKLPGPAIGNVPCAVTFATESAINAILQLLATPQNLAAFTALLAPTATLVINGGAPITGPDAIGATLTNPPEFISAIVLNSATFGSTNGGTNLTASVQATETITLVDSPPVSFPLTIEFVFNAQCFIQSIDVTGMPMS